jgi:uncharacterized protein (TIGR03118 family)
MRPSALRLAGTALAVLVVSSTARAQYQQTILQASDTSQPGVTANTIINPNLLNPWGFSFTATSPIWISDQNSSVLNADGKTQSGVATLIGVNQAGVASPNPLIVNVPNEGNTAPNGSNGPTGQVTPGAVGIISGTNDFPVIAGKPSEANFIFANLDGSLAAWKSGTSGTLATTVQQVDGASFTGLAIGNAAATSFGNTTGSTAFLYAADQNSAKVDVFNSQWNVVGQFAAPLGLPAGFTAFNAQNIGGIIYVTYADPTGGTGGVVAEFNPDGTFIKTLVSDPTGKWLDQPWGVALAPGNFGPLSNDILVTNNDSNGWISAFNAGTGTFVSLLMIGGTPFGVDGMWGLEFGNGGAGNNGNGPASTLFFTAGPGDTTGVFGAITPVPEPTSLVLIGLGGVVALSLRRRLVVRRG